jgi:hypothetical protein
MESTCEESENEQGDATFCADYSPFVEGGEVTVFCSSTAGDPIRVYPTLVVRNQLLTLKGEEEGEELPDHIRCSIKTPSVGGALLQSLVISSAGSVSLRSKDRFGALRLEKCDETDCIEEFRYRYDRVDKFLVTEWEQHLTLSTSSSISVSNPGYEALQIVSVEVIENGSTVDYLPMSTLHAGAVTVFERVKVINPCEPDETISAYETDVAIEAHPYLKSGEKCLASSDRYTVLMIPPSSSPPNTVDQQPTASQRI